MMRAVARWAFDHRADLLAALVYLCLAFLSFNALAEYANSHHLFPEPWGGWAFAVAVDGTVLYAFITFRRARLMAGTLLVAGAVTTYMLQRWHAEQAPHPLIVAGVVPGLMVLVTLAWHLIRDVSQDVPGSRSPRQQAATPAPERPGRVAERRPAATARATRGLTAQQRARVTEWHGQGRSARAIARDLGLSNHARSNHLAPFIAELERANAGNGGGP
jgi:hypothetical protein